MRCRTPRGARGRERRTPAQGSEGGERGRALGRSHPSHPVGLFGGSSNSLAPPRALSHPLEPPSGPVGPYRTPSDPLAPSRTPLGPPRALSDPIGSPWSDGVHVARLGTRDRSSPTTPAMPRHTSPTKVDPTSPTRVRSSRVRLESSFLLWCTLVRLSQRAGACWRPLFDDLEQDVAPV